MAERKWDIKRQVLMAKASSERMEKAFLADEPIYTASEVAMTLKKHFLAALVCDHEAKTDVPHCSCSLWPCEPQPSLGAAVDRYIEHFTDALAKSVPSGRPSP